MMLLVDIGNTRVKWAILREGALSRGEPLAHRGQPLPALWESMWGTMSCPEGIIVANVAGGAFEESLIAWVAGRWALRPEFIRATETACGVRNGYHQPAQLGVDRWLGLIGARQLEAAVGQDLCVIGCGTALTVDIVTAAGEHLGGWIAPGIGMMGESLSQGAAALAGTFGQGGGEMRFGRSTEEAVVTGIRQAAAGMVDRALLAARSVLGQAPVCVVSGGAAEDIARFLPSDASVVPDLVLRGLAAIVLQRD